MKIFCRNIQQLQNAQVKWKHDDINCVGKLYIHFDKDEAIYSIKAYVCQDHICGSDCGSKKAPYTNSYVYTFNKDISAAQLLLKCECELLSLDAPYSSEKIKRMYRI
jgi:hypothetical protein